ncbi:MAG: hypothetical protein IPG04_17655 [Polyangiaceae bacterium]|nr:hypothetical protein [Polyangiaceae bacterium]
MAAVKVIEQGYRPRDVGSIAVGTETTVDQSKSIAAYVLGMLERRFGVDLREAGALQFQFAHRGDVRARGRRELVSRGEATKPYALVIATDISKYPPRTSGEYTQGAGAVAMLVRPRARGSSRARPARARDHHQGRARFLPPQRPVDGGRRRQVLDRRVPRLHRGGLPPLHQARERGAGVTGRASTRLVDDFLFHIPFPRMAEYAALRVLGEAWRADPARRGGSLAGELLDRPRRPRRPRNRRAFEKQLAQDGAFVRLFEQRIAPSLSLSRRIGNIYSGSMYLPGSRAWWRPRRIVGPQGRRVGFFSYGQRRQRGSSAACSSTPRRTVRTCLAAGALRTRAGSASRRSSRH